MTANDEPGNEPADLQGAYDIAGYWANARRAHDRMVANECSMCLDVLVPGQAQVQWPHCGHASHATCAYNFLRAQRPPPDGAQWPALDSIRRVQCPARGEIIMSANAIEACIQRWGADNEAIQRYEHMTTLAIPLDVEQRGASSTTHAVVDDYAERTYARDDIPAPPAPEAIIPLCHTLVGPPPDFCTLPDRRMPWSPLAMHDPSTRAIIGWVHQWVCNTCSATITEHDAQPASVQGACTACNSWLGLGHGVPNRKRTMEMHPAAMCSVTRCLCCASARSP